MITEIFFSYPWWELLIVIGVGLLYSGLLYYQNPLNKLSMLMSIILAVFRFLVVSFLGFLLLSPYIRTTSKQIEKPIIIIGHDNSTSVSLGKDSVFYVYEFANNFADLKSDLNLIADVDSYVFGEKVLETDSVSYGDNTSNYSEFISFVKQNYSGLNVGALVILGDGIANRGIDPVYAANDINYPILTVALGDTSQTKDIIIDEIRSNSIVYSGDIFPIEVNISAGNLEGITTTVRLIENNKEISNKRISITNNAFHSEVKFNVRANETGKRRFRVIIDEAKNEAVNNNNFRDIFVDVLDSRLKILILAVSPHPDLGAVKQSLEHNPNFKVTIDYTQANISVIEKSDVIILYQIPSQLITTNNLLRDVVSSGLPILYITGKNSSYSTFNRYFAGLKVNSSVGTMARAQLEANPVFGKFTFDKELFSQLAVLPPLSVPLANYQIIDGLDIFAWQKISDVVTDFPLIAYYKSFENRSAVIMGEGIWLWRIQSFVQFGNTSAIDALLSKTIMYLSSENDKRRFKVISDGNYDSRNDIIIKAELYNEALEPFNAVDVDIVLKDENKEVYNFIFTPFDNYYTLNLNKLPVGIYSYEASANIGNERLSDRGEFIVQKVDYESRRLIADHRLLSRLANNHEGNMYYPWQLDKLKDRITTLDTLKSKVHYQDTFTGLNTIVYVMILLIFMMSVEWFLRKYFGNY